MKQLGSGASAKACPSPACTQRHRGSRQLRIRCCSAHAAATAEASAHGLSSVRPFELPCIDVSVAVAGQAVGQDLADQVAQACQHTGFFAITGHQCSMTMVEAAMREGCTFFDMPTPHKDAHIVQGMRAGRGYEMSPEHHGCQAHVESILAGHEGSEELRQKLQAHAEPAVRQGRMSERFMCGPDTVPDRQRHKAHTHTLALDQAFFECNAWPQDHSALRSAMECIYRDFAQLSAALLRIFAVALQQPAHFFEDKADAHASNLQVANYSSLVVPPQGCMRKKAHVDSGTFTILASDDWTDGTWQAGNGGLQLLPPDGQWREVAPPPGALLINVGNLLSRWTNGRWQSTMHRVTNPPMDRAHDSRRSSVAFFHKVNTDALVEVLPSCVDAAHPCAFAPQHARELSRQGVLWRHRHLPAEEASAAYHAELQELRQVQRNAASQQQRSKA